MIRTIWKYAFTVLFRSSWIQYLSIVCLGFTVVNGNTVIAKGSHFVRYKISNNSTRIQSLYSWFQNPNNHLDIIRANPTYHRVELISDKLLRIELLPVICPGLKIYQTVDYDIYHNSTTLILTSRPDTLKSVYQGSKFISNLLFKSSTTSTLHSKSIISIKQFNDIPYLDKEEKVEMNMCFRNLYIPGILNRITTSASNAIQNSLILNMNHHLDSILELFSIEETKQILQQQSSSSSSSSSFGRMRRNVHFYMLSKMISSTNKPFPWRKKMNNPIHLK